MQNQPDTNATDEDLGALPLYGMRILVVDDDSDIAETMAALLEMDGAEASPCTSAREALKKLAQGSWNVVLLDIGMPEMDGVEVAQVIPDSALGARLFIVAITGHSQAQIR